jgi:hypothetical protein
MGMVLQLAAPCVQDGDDADLGAEVLAPAARSCRPHTAPRRISRSLGVASSISAAKNSLYPPVNSFRTLYARARALRNATTFPATSEKCFSRRPPRG